MVSVDHASSKRAQNDKDGPGKGKETLKNWLTFSSLMKYKIKKIMYNNFFKSARWIWGDR